MENTNSLTAAKKFYVDDLGLGESRETANKYFDQYVVLMTENDGVKKGERALIKCLVNFFTENAVISPERVKEMVYEKVKRNVFIPIPEKDDFAFRATSTSPIGLVTLVDPNESGSVSPSTFFADSETIVIKEDSLIPFSETDALGRLPPRLFTLLQISQYFRLYIARVSFLSKLSEDTLSPSPMKRVLKEERERLKTSFDILQRTKKEHGKH